MKAGIVICLGDMVKTKFGPQKWEASLVKAGLSKNTIFIPIQDIDDATVMRLIEATCRELGVTLEQAADAFGDYWVNVYAPKIYRTYFRGSQGAKEFLLQMDRVHESVTTNVPNARPPRFTYEWVNDKTLVMKYRSNRSMIDVLVGCAKGVGKFFNESIKVRKIGADKIEVMFP
ncbi:MAG TPA: heme NO-binding domain-containing protein [Geobacterales bacterium]|nr:heme NO-binding domain-containing protein [Geobacterales bacterium]